MTIASLLLIVLILVLFLKNRTFSAKYISIYFIMLFLNLFCSMGYFLKVGSFELFYDEFVTILLFIFSLIYLLKGQINKNLTINLIVLIISMSISVLLNVFSNTKEFGIKYGNAWDSYFWGTIGFEQLDVGKRTFLMSGRLYVYLINLYVFITLIHVKDLKKLLKLLRKLSVLAIVLFFLEFVFKNVFHSYGLNNLYFKIFGYGYSQKDSLDFVDGYATITFLYREQSVVGKNFPLIAILLLYDFHLNKQKKAIIVSLGLIVCALLSMSFTSILTIFIYVIFWFYITKKYNSNLFYFSIFLSAILVLVLSIFSLNITMNATFETRIENSFNIIFNYNKDIDFEITSENIRLYSIMYNFQIFLSHMFFGIGIGTSYSLGGISSSLVSIGLIGSLIYILYIDNLFCYKFATRISKLALFSILFINLFSGGIDLLYNEIYLLPILFSTLDKKAKAKNKIYVRL